MSVWGCAELSHAAIQVFVHIVTAHLNSGIQSHELRCVESWRTIKCEQGIDSTTRLNMVLTVTLAISLKESLNPAHLKQGK